MSRITPLINAYRHHLTVPWPAGLAAIQRVIFAVYDKADELRLRTHIGEFDQATQQTGRCWLLIDLTDAFPDPGIPGGLLRLSGRSGGLRDGSTD